MTHEQGISIHKLISFFHTLRILGAGRSKRPQHHRLTQPEREIFLEVRALLERAQVELSELPDFCDLNSPERDLVESALVLFIMSMQARGMTTKQIKRLTFDPALLQPYRSH